MLDKPARKPGRRLTDDEKPLVLKRYKANDRVEDIARDFDVTYSVISQLARLHGVSRGVGKGRKKPEDGETLCDILAAEGMADAAAAAERPAQHSQQFYSPTRDEILRLHEKGVAPSRIVALLRVPYGEVNAALAPQVSRKEGYSMERFLPQIGKTVVFRLHSHAVTQINGRRHSGRKVKIGDEFPMLIVRIDGKADDENAAISGKVETDDGSYFASSVKMGEAAGECREV